MPKNKNIEPNHMKIDDGQVSDLPKLSSPAHRALASAGYLRLEQFSKLTEAEVLKLHGMGPKALEQIRHALAAKGQSFADGS
ncbi:DNA-binding protein [Paenibacillus sp. LMG 31458]|uniref:DNA-binding protein n=1 Tax=Paenibacillus phytorum TaxID=2654977 RepID=A0ABX1XRV3_9BACL|nr:DNA-binding protein [Paenibacillus phytorum]NOU71019.1 DNA-binding protein [Paenibacillus phytorum]